MIESFHKTSTERIHELNDLYEIGSYVQFQAKDADTDIPYLQPQVLLEGMVVKKDFNPYRCKLIVRIGGTEILVSAEKVNKKVNKQGVGLCIN